MLRIHADHPHHTLAVDDLAFVAHLFNGCPYFHKSAFREQFDDPAPRPVMRRKFHSHSISRTQPYKIRGARSRGVRHYNLFVRQLQAIRRTRQKFDHLRRFAF
jgi:hypothetical protein